MSNPWITPAQARHIDALDRAADRHALAAYMEHLAVVVLIAVLVAFAAAWLFVRLTRDDDTDVNPIVVEPSDELADVILDPWNRAQYLSRTYPKHRL